MNEFFKLLRDFVIFIPLAVLIFGVFFSLVAAAQQNLSLLLVGLIIFLYGLVASYVRQIYKDLLNFLRKEQLSNSKYLSKWKKYHFWYYFVQFILLGIFIYVLGYFLFRQNNGSFMFPQITFSSGVMNFDWNATAAIVQVLSALLVGISLIWIAKNTKTTGKMVENQMMPAVEVNMIYDKQEKKTYFWFLNASTIPALISMSLKIKDKEHYIGPLRIAPYHPQIFHFKKTATPHDFLEGNESEETEAILNIEVKPAYDNQEIKFSFTKNYRFSTTQKEWNESTWSYPDLPFLQQKQTDVENKKN